MRRIRTRRPESAEKIKIRQIGFAIQSEGMNEAIEYSNTIWNIRQNKSLY